MEQTNARQGMYWRVSRYYPMIQVKGFVIDAVFGEVMPYDLVADKTPEGIHPTLYFSEWCDLSYDGIGGVEDYIDLVHENYTEEEIEELAEKFDFFTKF